MRALRHAGLMQATTDEEGTVTLTMTRAELIGLRELVAFMDFSGDLPSRHDGEDKVVDALLRAADPLIPELGTDEYGRVVEAAWRQLVDG